MINIEKWVVVTQSGLFAGSVFCLRKAVISMLELNGATLAVVKFIEKAHFKDSLRFIHETLVDYNKDELLHQVHSLGAGEIENKRLYVSAAKAASWGSLSISLATLAFALTIVHAIFSLF